MKKTIIILLAILAYGIPSIYSQIQVSKFPSIEVTGTSTITIDPSVDPDSDIVYWEAIQSALEDAKAKAEFIQPYFGAGELYPWMMLEDDPEDFVDHIQLSKNSPSPHHPIHRRYTVKVIFLIQ